MDILQIPVRPGGEPALAKVANAQLAVEKWERRTKRWQQLVVVLSVPMAYRLFAGAEGGSLGVRLILCIWLATFVSLFVCAEAGWRAARRLDRLLLDAGGRRR
jgi:hypothetical protein